jgi:Ca2+/Na+ antiporter
MEEVWVLLIAVLMFAVFVFLFLKLTSSDAKTEYGTKMWKHWPTRLSYYQGVIFYSAGLTLITMFLLKWANVLTW